MSLNSKPLLCLKMLFGALIQVVDLESDQTPRQTFQPTNLSSTSATKCRTLFFFIVFFLFR